MAKLLLLYAENLGLATYDPFDIKATPFLVRTQNSKKPIANLGRKSILGVELFAPIFVRKIFRIPKRISPGAVGRMAQAYLANGDITNSRKMLEWLLENPGESNNGLGWGVPFDWSAHFGLVPAYTAVAHTTQTCGHAFLDYFEKTQETWAWDAAARCCDFLKLGLNITNHGSGQSSLSYTRFDTSEVVNITAGAAELMIRTGRDEDQSLAMEFANFTLKCQLENGGIPYHSLGSVEGSNPIDHYHTAMVLSSLHQVPGQEFENAYRLGLKFHLKSHFEVDGCPKMTPENRFPIDSMSAGMSLLILGQALQSPRIDDEIRNECFTTLKQLIQYSKSHLINSKGAVCYRIYPQNSMWLDSLRWSQALFALAIQELVRADQNEAPK